MDEPFTLKQFENSEPPKKKPRGTPFPKGQSGNPKGRPKGKTLTELIRAKLLEQGADGEPLDIALARIFVASALSGDFKFAKEIIDRMDGKVPDRLAGADGQDLKINVHYADLDPAPPALGPADDPQGDEEI